MIKSLITVVMLMLGCLFSVAFGQSVTQSFEGTTKGAVVADWKPVTEEFKATQGSGPWNSQGKGRKTSVALVPLGVSPQNALALVTTASKTIAKAISQNSDLEVVQSKALDSSLKTRGISSRPQGNEIENARDYLLSSYDVTVFMWFDNGWLKISAYHATSKSQALRRAISVYFGPTPSDTDVANLLKPKDVIDSINTVLGRKTD
jgi:hypothetical protein